MKIRQGFISNSSSSSFVIIKQDKYVEPNWDDNPALVPQPYSKIEFGWEFENTYDIDGKINFAVMQALYVKRDDWIDMIHEVVTHYTKHDLDIKLQIDIWNDPYYGYIDHQSTSHEDVNTEMFDSEESLKDFIFGSMSFIQGGNDNV